MGAAIAPFLWGLLKQLPGWVLVAGGIVLFYEGIPPLPLSLPFIGEISIIDGRVDKVRKAADERCRLQKVESKRLAERADQITQTEAARRRAEQERAAAGQLAAALAEKESYENEVADLSDSLRTCRRATDADVRRLR